MRGVSGRVKLFVVCTVGLVVLLGLGLHQAGFTWGLVTSPGQDSAARAALTALLLQLPAATAPAEPALEGREATAEEAAALDKSVNGFLEAMRKREYAAAWELVTNVPEGVDQGKWVEGLGKVRPEIEDQGEELVAVLGGRKARLVDVKTWGDGGVAMISVMYRTPLWLSLVRKDGAWLIDGTGSDDLQARESLGQQLEDLGRGTADSIFRQMIALEGETGPRSYLDLLIVSPQTARHEVASRRLQDDRATVRLQTQAELYLVLSVKRGPEGWALHLREPVKIVPPDHRLSRADAGSGGATSSSSPRRAACLSNLKQLGLAMMMYCQDYDERFAPADKWSAVLYPYARNEAVFSCPAAGKYGYAMNYKLSRGYLGRVAEPATTLMLFNSSLLQPNAYDKGGMPGDSLPAPPRHEGYNNFAFSDGHVQSLLLLPAPAYYRPYREGQPLAPLVDGPGGPGGPGVPGAPGGPPGGTPPPPPAPPGAPAGAG